MHDSDIPPGWSYNPASWPQRLPIIGMALLGFVIASYLALYQMRIIPTVWEPFFGHGSVIILNSWVSHLLPISDAALGALAYLADVIAGVIGGNRRWRTLPWIVVLFGIFVGPLGIVSVLLVILQPVLFDAWCTLCLVTAVISVAMIGPAMDEVLATLQYLKREHTAGRSWWRALWGLSPEVEDPKSEIRNPKESGFGFRIPNFGSSGMWAQIVSIGLGVWLMAAPSVLGYGDPARTHDHIIGPLVATAAAIAVLEATRGARWANLVFGIWLVLAPWFLGYDWNLTLHSTVVGLPLAALACVRGVLRDRIGGGWSVLWKSSAEIRQLD